MNVHLHIDRLSIRIPGVTRSQRHIVSAAVEQELTRLLASGELSFAPDRADFNGVPAFDRGAAHGESTRLKLGHDHGPSALGTEIARAVYGRVAAAAAGPATQRKRPHVAMGKGAGR